MRDYTAEEFQTIEDGVYPATLARIEEAPDGQYGPAYKFFFAVEMEDSDDTMELSVFCSDPEHFTARTKLRRWANAILNREIADGERFNPKMLLKQPCRVIVKNEEGEKGTFAKVKDVLPRKQSKKKAKPAADDDVDEFLAS